MKTVHGPLCLVVFGHYSILMRRALMSEALIVIFREMRRCRDIRETKQVSEIGDRTVRQH